MSEQIDKGAAAVALMRALEESVERAKAERLRGVFAKHLGETPAKPTRKQIETTLDVLGWLSSGDQDPAIKDDIAEIRMLLDILLDVGW